MSNAKHKTLSEKLEMPGIQDCAQYVYETISIIEYWFNFDTKCHGEYIDRMMLDCIAQMSVGAADTCEELFGVDNLTAILKRGSNEIASLMRGDVDYSSGYMNVSKTYGEALYLLKQRVEITGKKW